VAYDSQLRGFERITLQPGESRTVRFRIGPEQMVMLDKDMNWTVEPGEFELRIGSSSEDIRLKETLTVQ
jgi:beta-glucosidase